MVSTDNFVYIVGMVYIIGCIVTFLISVYMEIKIYFVCKHKNYEWNLPDVQDILEILGFILRSWSSVFYWFKYQMFLENQEEDERRK